MGSIVYTRPNEGLISLCKQDRLDNDWGKPTWGFLITSIVRQGRKVLRVRINFLSIF
jgi:hypothetical protein